MSEIVTGDLKDEEYREYEFGISATRTIYRIPNPITLFFRKGGTTHRILDSTGVVHCLPAVGVDGCVLRWKPKEGANPVAF